MHFATHYLEQQQNKEFQFVGSLGTSLLFGLFDTTASWHISVVDYYCYILNKVFTKPFYLDCKLSQLPLSRMAMSQKRKW